MVEIKKKVKNVKRMENGEHFNIVIKFTKYLLREYSRHQLEVRLKISGSSVAS